MKKGGDWMEGLGDSDEAMRAREAIVGLVSLLWLRDSCSF